MVTPSHSGILVEKSKVNTFFCFCYVKCLIKKIKCFINQTVLANIFFSFFAKQNKVSEEAYFQKFKTKQKKKFHKK